MIWGVSITGFVMVECFGNSAVVVRAQLEQTSSVFIHFPSAVVSQAGRS